MRVAIIGGGVSGTTLAFHLRRLNKGVEIYIIEASEHTQYSPCSMPYTLSEENLNLDDIYIFREEDYIKNNIHLLRNTRVEKILPQEKKLLLKTNSTYSELFYDKLVIATGARPFIPPIKGLNEVEYFTFNNIDDAKRVTESIKDKKRYAIIGAGFIGVEVAHSLAALGKKVSLIEVKEAILPAVLDPDMAKVIEEYFKDKINFFVNAKIREIKKNLVVLEDGVVDYDILLVCTGKVANKEIAEKAGIATDRGILISKKGETSQKDIYALGDCAQLKGVNFQPAKLASVAVRQAKALAKILLGEEREFPEVTNVSISKLGKLFVGSVGINSKMSREEIIAGKYSGKTKDDFIPEAKDIWVKILADKEGILLGAQLIGEEEVVGRIDLLSLALQHHMSIYDIANAETAYNPFCAPIFDPIVLAAQNAIRKLEFLKRRKES